MRCREEAVTSLADQIEAITEDRSMRRSLKVFGWSFDRLFSRENAVDAPPRRNGNHATLRRLLTLLAVFAVPIYAGFGGSDHVRTIGRQSAQIVPRSLRSRIVGRWTTNPDPEMSRTTINFTFLESGEYQESRPFLIAGWMPIMCEQDGKRSLMQNSVTGTWELVDDEIHVRVADANVRQDPLPGKLEPIVYSVRGAGDRWLLLNKSGKDFPLIPAE